MPGYITNTGYNSYIKAKIACCYYSGSGDNSYSTEIKGVGTEGYSMNYPSFDYGTARVVDINTSVSDMNENIDKWNTEHPDCICNYKYELDADGVPTLVKQTQN